MRTMSGGPCQHYDCSNRNSFGYCKTTACINPKYSNIGTAQYGQGVQMRIVTNADRIRSMSDEELAEWLECHCDCASTCMAMKPCCAKSEKDCVQAWKEWLRQEVER